MTDIDDLVNQAMTEWDGKTNCGEDDPAFQGEVGEEIDRLVDGLRPEQIDNLLATEKPIIFVMDGGHANDR